MIKRQRHILAWLAAILGVFWTGGATAQTYQPEGPAPSSGPVGFQQSGDGPNGRTGTVAGAIQGVVPDPNDANTIYASGVAGGVWVTHNGGGSWTPLTDKQNSLAIASLALDPSNNQILIAGTGFSGNGIYDSAGLSGRTIGVLYSTTGGASWSELGGATFHGQSIVGVAARGRTLLAATANLHNPSAGGGLYSSPDQGITWNQIGASSGLPTGAVSSLVGDSTDQKLFYAAVNGAGIYVSTNTGATWNPINGTGSSPGPTLTAQQAARLASGPNGSVVAAIYDARTNETGGQLTALWLSKDNGQHWTQLATPPTNAGNQAETNLAVAIDRTNQNIVYVAGDRLATATTIAAYRVVLNADLTSSYVPLTNTGTANGTTIHADSRTFAFDAAGRLLLSSDGGIYALTNPSSGSGDWTGLNGSGLALKESLGIAYDSRSHRIALASQDTGVALQSAPRSAGYTAIGGGDGVNTVVNDTSDPNVSILYYSSQGLGGLSRTQIDSTGARQSTKSVLSNRNFFQADDFSNVDDHEQTLPFYSRIVLNKIDPTNIVIGTNYIYTTTDSALETSAASPLTMINNIAGVPDQKSGVTALAYGTVDAANAILAGTRYHTVQSGSDVYEYKLFLSQTGSPTTLTPVTAYAGLRPYSVSFDYNTYSRFFVADGHTVWGTTNTGTSFTDYSSQLSTVNIVNPVALEFISKNGVNALAVGGLVGSATGPSPIAVADSNASGLSNWRAFGAGLPPALVSSLSYNPTADVLAVGTWGRGAWLLYDVTSYFASASVLQYGLADNDSAPDAAFLTNGNYGNRSLEKSGSGTLSIAGTALYTGSTTLSGGTTVVNGSIASSSSLIVGPGALLQGGGIVPKTTMNGTIAPGGATNAPTTMKVAGDYTQGAGGLYQAIINAAGQSDRLNVTGSATLNGTVNLVVTPGNYGARTTYTILNATNGRNGAFRGLTNTGLPFLNASLTYDANNAYVQLTPGGFAQGGQSGNQGAVGSALDRSVSGATGDFATVLGALGQLTAAQAPGVFDQLSGQNYSGFSTGAVQSAHVFMTNFSQQVGGGQTVGGNGGSRIALAEACDAACDIADQPRWGAWGGVLAGLGTIAGNANANGLTYNIGGFSTGIDYRFDPSFVAGVTMGYTSSSLYTQGLSGTGSSETVQAGLYGTYTLGEGYLDALAGYARSSNQMQRSIVIPGLEPRTALGLTTADQFFGLLETGYRIDMGGRVDSFVTPFARLQGSTATQAAFSETGAGSLGLNVAAQTTNSLRSVLGGQIGAGLDLGWRDKLALVLRLGWSHEYADTDRPVTASFVGAPANNFSVAGAAAPRDGAVLGLGANTAVSDATSLFARYDGELQGGNTSHIFSAGVRVVW